MSPRELLFIGGAFGVQALELDTGMLFSMQDLPYRNVTALAHDDGWSDGHGNASDALYIGAVHGSSRVNPCPSSTTCGMDECVRGRQWRAFGGQRWMPATDTTALSMTAITNASTQQQTGSTAGPSSSCDDGNAARGNTLVIVTERGITKLRPTCWTLERKAAHFTEQLRRSHVDSRFGLVRPLVTSRPGSMASARLSLTDNDGLWTSMAAAGLLLGLASSTAPSDHHLFHARQRVSGPRRSTGASVAGSDSPPNEDLLQLVSVLQGGLGTLMDASGVLKPLVMSRSVTFSDDPSISGATCSDATPTHCWRNSTKYPGVAYKNDCSSDEVVGHVFFHALAAILCEHVDGAEQMAKVSAARLDALVGSIVDNGFVLRNETGDPTTWGHWDLEWLNDRSNSDERGLNAVQIISHLRAAEVRMRIHNYAHASRSQ